MGYGSLYLNKLTSAEALKLPSAVHGNIDLSRLPSAQGLQLPVNFTGKINFHGRNWSKAELTEILELDLR